MFMLDRKLQKVEQTEMEEKNQYCAISVQTRWPNLLSSEGMKQERLSDCPRLKASRGICSPQDFNSPLAQRPEGTFWCRLFWTPEL